MREMLPRIARQQCKLLLCHCTEKGTYMVSYSACAISQYRHMCLPYRTSNAAFEFVQFSTVPVSLNLRL